MEKKDIIVKIKDTRFAIRMSDGIVNGRYRWVTHRHCNADYEFHAVLNGGCEMEVGEKTFLLTNHQAVLVAPGQYHNPRIIAENFERFSLSFGITADTLGKSLCKRVSPCVVLDFDDETERLILAIFQEIEQTKQYQEQMLHALCEKLMVLMLRQLDIPSENTESELAADWRLGIIDNFFVMPMEEGATESDLAKKVHLSVRQLSRVLQNHYGMTFRQKMLSSHMEYAGWLLRTTRQGITEICALVGYKSEATFYHNFHQYYGVTPKQYRNSRRKEER